MKLARAVKMTVERFIKSGNFEWRKFNQNRQRELLTNPTTSSTIRFGTLNLELFRGRVQFFVAFL